MGTGACRPDRRGSSGPGPSGLPGQRSYPGLFWAATNLRTLVYGSLLELDRLWLADFESTVVAMATQPFQVTGRYGAAQRSHVPDVLLVHADRSVTLVDVKPAAFLNKPLVRALTRRPYCEARFKLFNVQVDIALTLTVVGFW